MFGDSWSDFSGCGGRPASALMENAQLLRTIGEYVGYYIRVALKQLACTVYT